MGKQYYTLVGSLPPLPYFATAEVLPIGSERLERRLKMLDEDDAADLARARSLMQWHEHPATRTEEQIGAQYEAAMEKTRNRELRATLEMRISTRTVLAAVRRRRRGLGRPELGETWGFGPLVRTIESKWEAKDFGLGRVIPWLADAIDTIERGAALDFEREIMDRVWRRLKRSADAQSPFGFERVFTYVFQWDIVRRWLSYEPEAATARFQKLIAEVTHDQQELFA